jgi:hypothetical protein
MLAFVSKRYVLVLGFFLKFSIPLFGTESMQASAESG